MFSSSECPPAHIRDHPSVVRLCLTPHQHCIKKGCLLIHFNESTALATLGVSTHKKVESGSTFATTQHAVIQQGAALDNGIHASTHSWQMTL